MSGLTLIASYPKSGNTWMRAFLASHAKGGGAIDLNSDLAALPSLTGRALQDRHAGLEHSDLTPAEVALLRPDTSRRIAAAAPGLYKTHDSNLIPPGADACAIPADVIDRMLYLVRDPRDVAVSAAHHFGWTLEESVAALNDPTFTMGRSVTRLGRHVSQFASSWSAHVDSWTQAETLRILVLRYEDMKAAPLDAFSRACRFLARADDPALVRRCVEASSFGALAAQEAERGFRERLPDATAAFFRSGRSGGWRDALPATLADRLVGAHRRVMERFGYL